MGNFEHTEREKTGPLSRVFDACIQATEPFIAFTYDGEEQCGEPEVLSVDSSRTVFKTRIREIGKQLMDVTLYPAAQKAQKQLELQAVAHKVVETPQAQE